ncbi:hypothetical protein ACC772_39160, partial [Rhizobium ruizarguesonis]
AVGSIAEKSGAVAAAMTMSGNGTISLGKDDARSIFISQMSGELTDVHVDLCSAVMMPKLPERSDMKPGGRIAMPCTRC